MSISDTNKESLEPYAELASNEIRVAMVKHRVKYEDLVTRLAARNIHYSSSNLRNKVSQNMLSASLFLVLYQCITQADTLTIDLPKQRKA